MAATLFPLQFQRQQAAPIDADDVFQTTAARVAYLTSPRRYPGMVVFDVEANAMFALTAANTWLELVTTTSTQTLQNKRIAARVGTVVAINGAAQTNVDTFDTVVIDHPGPENLQPTIVGTPLDGQKLIIKAKCVNSVSIVWPTNVSASNTGGLPTSTTGSNATDYFGLIFDSTDNAWHLVAVASNF